MAGVEVVDGNPVEPGAEVSLHLRHETTGERLEVVILNAVFGRDDEAELMTVAVRAIEESSCVDAVGVGAVELARLAFAGDAVALEIPQMRPRPVSSLASQLHDPCLDDRSTLPERSISVA
nr:MULTISPECIES: hypothetical protein [unclassified Mesorhizobium]